MMSMIASMAYPAPCSELSLTMQPTSTLPGYASSRESINPSTSPSSAWIRKMLTFGRCTYALISARVRPCLPPEAVNPGIMESCIRHCSRSSQSASLQELFRVTDEPWNSSVLTIGGPMPEMIGHALTMTHHQVDMKRMATSRQLPRRTYSPGNSRCHDDQTEPG